MIELKVISGPDRGLRIGFGTETIDLGRDSSSGFVLSDPRVAPRHAQIVLSDSRYMYVDLDSPDGSTVNQEEQIIRLEQGGRRSVVLTTGACIGVGSSVIEVTIRRHPRARTSRLATGKPSKKTATMQAAAPGVDAQELIDWSGKLTCWDGLGAARVVRTQVPIASAQAPALPKSSGPTTSIFGDASPPPEARIDGTWMDRPTRSEAGSWRQPSQVGSAGGKKEPSARLFLRKEGQLKALLQLCGELLPDVSFNPMLAAALRAVLPMFPRATCGGLFLRTSDGFVPSALHFAPGETELPAELAFSRDLVEWVAVRDRSIRHPQGLGIGELDQAFREGPTQSSVLAPLRVSSGLVGIFGVSSTSDHHAFSSRDILRCEVVAGLLATSLQRARGADARRPLFERALLLCARTVELAEPARAGHAERVAASAAALARAVPGLSQGHHAAARPGAAAIERVRLAALLHDLGRCGIGAGGAVRSHAQELQTIQKRFEHIVARFTAQAQERLLRALVQHGRAPTPADLARLAGEQGALKTHLQKTLQYLRQLSEVPQLGEAHRAWLDELRTMEIRLGEGESYPLIDDRELEALRQREGFPSAHEAQSIAGSRRRAVGLLEQLPWPAELRGLPELLARFHQTLEGGPAGAGGADLECNILAVACCFDSLLLDGVPQAMALSVLQRNAAAGSLDPELVGLFVRLVGEQSSKRSEASKPGTSQPPASGRQPS